MSLSELPCKISFAPVHNRPAASRWLAVVLVLGLLPFRLMAQETQTLSPEVLADFATARKLAERPDNDPRAQEELNVLVRKLAPHFPLVSVAAGIATNHFFKMELNQHKTGFHGVRFKVPAGPERDMAAVFAVPHKARPVRWSLVAMDGSEIRHLNTQLSEGKDPKGYYFGTAYDRFVPWGKDGADFVTIKQHVIGGQLKAGGEYVYWFSFTPSVPFPFQAAITLPPAENRLQWEQIMDFVDD